MFNKLNTVWKHLLLDITLGIVMIILGIYNFSQLGKKEFAASDYTIIIIWAITVIHALLIFIMAVINLFKKLYLKSFFFLILFIALSVALYFAIGLIFISSVGVIYTDEAFVK